MSKYLISLTPAGKFFFGGDMTFERKGDDEHNERFSSYIIESQKFPQQTSLLGMLRFLILSNDSVAFNKATQEISSKQRASELIGATSFTGTKTKFGKINSLTPCHLQHHDNAGWKDIYADALVDTYVDADGKHVDIAVDFSHSFTAIVNEQERTVLPKLEGFDCKLQRKPTYGTFSESEIFFEDKRMGIDRDIKTGKTDKDALYKQVCYRMADDFRFAFEADVDIDLTRYDKQLVSVGADNSQFIIGIEKVDQVQAPEAQWIEGKINVVTLTSNALISGTDALHACYAVTALRPFRHLKTSVDGTDKYNVLLKIKRSEKCYLYKAGSTFYFDSKNDFDAFVHALAGDKGMRQIGYNYFKTSTINK